MLDFLGNLPSVTSMWTALIGGGMLGYGVYLVVTARQMQRWPMVIGTIAESKVREIAPWEQHSSGSDYSDIKQTLYEPVIAYDYVVDGHEYRGRRISVAKFSASMQTYAESRIAEYPVGRQVSVYVNPEDPKDAIVERTSAPIYAGALVVLGAALAIGGLVWGFGVESR
jgi:hypothetical protein